MYLSAIYINARENLHFSHAVINAAIMTISCDIDHAYLSVFVSPALADVT